MKMTLPECLKGNPYPDDAVYWCPVREAFFRGERRDGRSYWVAYTKAGEYVVPGPTSADQSSEDA